MRQLSVSAGPAATLLVVGDPDNPLPTLIQNIDPVNVVYLGESAGINPAQPNTCAPLNPGQTSVASGDINVFGIAAPGQTVAVNVYRGLMSFFQPISQLVIAGPSAGIFLYSPTPGPGNLIGSWSSTAGVDQFGNTYPAGFQTVASATSQSVLTIQDSSGNTLFNVDASGNVSGAGASFDSLSVAGLDLFNDILPPYPLGVTNRGWVVSASNWPAVAIGNAETAILELDFTVPPNRQWKLEVPSVNFIPTITTDKQQMIQRLKYTTDGSTPTTSSPQTANKSPGVIFVGTAQSGVNVATPNMEWFIPVLSTAQLYRVLLTAFVQGASNTFQYSASNEYLEMRTVDTGLVIPNTGVALGSGTSGSAGRQTYTKTYYATASHSYYGATGTYGSGHYGKRSDNASMWQSCGSSNAFLEGDQYSFANFNYAQINSDLAGATLNWSKLSLSDNTSFYSGGGNVICGYTTYTGSFGDPFIPGGGTHFNQEVWHINRGATLNHLLGSWFGPIITGGTFTAFAFGPASSYTGYTDQNNNMSFFGYSATPNNPLTPQLTLNYSK